MKRIKAFIILFLFAVTSLFLLKEINQTSIFIDNSLVLFLHPHSLVEKSAKKEFPVMSFTVTKEPEEFKVIPKQTTSCLYTIDNIPSPKGVAFSPSGEEIWVTSLMNTKRGVFVYRVKDGEMLAEITLPGGGAVEVVFDEKGDYAYVSQMETARVFKIDSKSKEVLGTLNTESSWTKVVELDEGGERVLASNWSGNNISAFDISSGRLLENIATVKTPRGIAIIDDFLYIAGFDNGEIEKINLKSKEKELLLRTEGAMRHIVVTKDEEYLFFSDMGNNEIYKLNHKEGLVNFFAKTETNPNTIVLAQDDNLLIVSNRGKNHSSGNYHIKGEEWGSVMIFDAKDGTLLDVLIGGNQPTALAANDKNQLFAYSNFLDGEVVICKLPRYDEVKKEIITASDYRQYLMK